MGKVRIHNAAELDSSMVFHEFGSESELHPAALLAAMNEGNVASLFNHV